MSKLTLTKKSKLTLKKSNGHSLRNLRAELRWDAPENTHAEYDADAVAFILNAQGKAVNNTEHFCFYHQPETPAIVSSGDARNGGGDGEDLTINLQKVPQDGVKIQIVVTLDQAIVRRQSLAQINNGRLTLVDADTNEVLGDVNFDAVGRNDISMLFVELNRAGTEWEVENVNQGFTQDLEAWVKLHGIDLDA